MKPGEGVEESLLARVQELRQENERLRAANQHMFKLCTFLGEELRVRGYTVDDLTITPYPPIPSS